jgi:hypothetical protein
MKDYSSKPQLETIINDFQIIAMISAGQISIYADKQRKVPNKDAYLASYPPRLMPLVTFSLNPLSSDCALLQLFFAHSSYLDDSTQPNPTYNQIDAKGNLLEALIHDRRITAKNIVKWAQQLMVFSPSLISYFHK